MHDAESDAAISFGPFRLYPSRQLLLENDHPVRIGGRALDILIALVEHAGQLVRKDELMKRAWPNAVVEEGTLRVHLVALRKALGDGRPGRRFIVNVTGRGYRFVAPTERSTTPQSLPQASAATGSANNLPATLTRAIGRTAVIGALAIQLERKRFVTIVGPGGIGKTTVAMAVAERLTSSYKDGVRFVDLAPVTNPTLVPSVVAAALKMPVLSDDPTPGLIDHLRDRQLLIVLDSCEHLLETIAPLAVTLLLAAPGLHILATSREPLRAEGEGVRRLAPLETPPVTPPLSRGAAMTFPAVELFVERAKASVDDFELTDDNAPIVAEICRRLDGMALAIEFAAGRLDAFDVRSLATHLNDRFLLQLRGRRELQRHQTLHATLDWSYNLLSESERAVLRRLSVFAGNFTMEAASAVAREDIDTSGVIDCVADLVAKSLVSADARDTAMTYRLLDTTRAYALERLAESSEFALTARRHAEYYRDVLTQAEAESVSRPIAHWLAAYAGLIDNTRAALDWAFSADGDRTIALELTSVAVTLWIQLSLLRECEVQVKRAVSMIESAAAGGGRLEMRLFAALGYTAGDGTQREPALANALAIAERLGDIDYALRILASQLSGCFYAADFRAAWSITQRFQTFAAKSTDLTDPLIGAWLIGATLHALGDHAGARTHIQRMLDGLAPLVRKSHVARFGYDQQASARGTLASILWTQGFADQAMQASLLSVDEAVAADHAESLCAVLSSTACPLAFYMGDLAAAERYVDLMIESARHGGDAWLAWTNAFKAVLRISRNDLVGGLRALRVALDGLPNPWHPTSILLHEEFAQALGLSGEPTRGLALIDSRLDRAQRNEAHLCIPELLRFKGNLVLLQRERRAAKEAEAHFRRSIDIANSQGALALELRSAIPLSRLLIQQRRHTEAHQLLTPVYARFSEGFATADLVSAKAILNTLDH